MRGKAEGRASEAQAPRSDRTRYMSIAHNSASPKLSAALEYAERGFFVFPLVPGTKKPFGDTNGYLDATRDTECISRWWRRSPFADVGVACGLSHLVVVDVDVHRPEENGFVALAGLERIHGTLPATPRVMTPRDGVHHWLRGLCRKGKLAPGIDLLSDGGYVVAPPSFDGLYRWDQACDFDTPIADAPSWLFEDSRRQILESASPSPGHPVSESVLGKLCQARGWIRGCRGDRLFILCPWRDEHTTGDCLSSTVLFPPQEPGGLGWFHCSHSHCQGRGSLELLALFSEAERDAV
jgi:Bifunctional DNA primase/polymerase, N-terminal